MPFNWKGYELPWTTGTELSGSGAPAWSNAKAIDFGSSNTNATNYVDFSTNYGFDWTTAFSFLLWLYPDNVTANHCLLCRETAAGTGYDLRLGGTKLLLYMSHDNAAHRLQMTQTTATITANAWHQIALVNNSSGSISSANITIYVDGAAVAMTTNFNTETVNPTYSVNATTGAGLAGTGLATQGLHDELQIYGSYALTSGNITTLWHSGAAADPTATGFAANLTHYYRFENGVTDSVGSINGTIVGSPTYSTNHP